MDITDDERIGSDVMEALAERLMGIVTLIWLPIYYQLLPILLIESSLSSTGSIFRYVWLLNRFPMKYPILRFTYLHRVIAKNILYGIESCLRKPFYHQTPALALIMT